MTFVIILKDYKKNKKTTYPTLRF